MRSDKILILPIRMVRLQFAIFKHKFLFNRGMKLIFMFQYYIALWLYDLLTSHNVFI